MIAHNVIAAEVRRRTWRVQVLQNRIDAMLALSQARAAMYADQKEGAHEFQVNTLAEERAAIDEGCHALPPGSAPPPADWKEGSPPLPHPTYPKTNGSSRVSQRRRNRLARQGLPRQGREPRSLECA